MTIYYKLSDELNKDEIVKETDGKGYTYRFGVEQWVRSAIMIPYRWPGDGLYDQYVSISEQTVSRMLDNRRCLLDDLYNHAVLLAEQDHISKKHNEYLLSLSCTMESTEHKIVAILQGIYDGTGITLDQLKEHGFTKRIINSVSILCQKKTASYEDYLLDVKKDSNAWNVKIADIRHSLRDSKNLPLTTAEREKAAKYQQALEILES